MAKKTKNQTRSSPPPSNLAKEFGTPLYVYNKNNIVHAVSRYQKALRGLDCTVHFAAKACTNLRILSLFRELGCGVDIVSGGELFRALKAGFQGKDIVFSGVGKTAAEIESSVSAELFTINVESYDEVVKINEIADRLGKTPRLSLRMNPAVNAKTHRHLTTGKRGSKFGLDPKELKKIFSDLSSFSAVRFVGLSCHIGSQIQELSTLESAWKELLVVAKNAPFEVRTLDLGGGLGVDPARDVPSKIEEYGARIQKVFKKAPYHLCIEPGRSLIADSAVLLTSVLAVKDQATGTFVVVDAGMNDLIRPALYQAEHPIWADEDRKGPKKTFTVVGPVCESADVFGTLKAAVPRPGDLLAIGYAGAYGMSMASEYNSRPRAAEVLVDRGKAQLIRSRGTYAELIEPETF